MVVRDVACKMLAAELARLAQCSWPMMVVTGSHRILMREKIAWALLLLGVSGFGFLTVDAHHASNLGSATPLALHTQLDVYTPFIPGFVYAYLLYYPWVMLPLPILRTRRAFFCALGAFAMVQAIGQVVFVVWPSHMERPGVDGLGISAELVRQVYRLDPGWNVFPSLHVAHSTLVAFLYYQHQRRHAPVVAAGAGLIALSTVLIKQHYVVDVPAGALVAWGCYALSERFRRVEADSEPAPPQAVES